MTVEVRVEHERGGVDHGHHGVEVHEGVAVGELDGHHRSGLAGVEQGMGQDLDGHGGGAFTHADQDRAVSDDMDVTTFDGGRLVVAVFVAVVGDEVASRRRGDGSR